MKRINVFGSFDIQTSSPNQKILPSLNLQIHSINMKDNEKVDKYWDLGRDLKKTKQNKQAVEHKNHQL